MQQDELAETLRLGHLRKIHELASSDSTRKFLSESNIQLSVELRAPLILALLESGFLYFMFLIKLLFTLVNQVKLPRLPKC